MTKKGRTDWKALSDALENVSLRVGFSQNAVYTTSQKPKVRVPYEDDKYIHVIQGDIMSPFSICKRCGAHVGTKENNELLLLHDNWHIEIEDAIFASVQGRLMKMMQQMEEGK